MLFHANFAFSLGCTKSLQRVLQLPGGLRNGPNVSLALSINCAFLENNPVRLLRLAQNLNFFQSCALHRHLAKCRKDLLLIYSHGFSSRNSRFPLDKLSQLLVLDKNYTTQYCQMFGVEINEENKVIFSRSAFVENAPGKVQCLQHHNTSKETLTLLKMGCRLHSTCSDKEILH